jgi:hypothetical protein
MAERRRIFRCTLERVIAKAAAGLLVGTAFIFIGIITQGAVRFNFISKKFFSFEHEFIPCKNFVGSILKELYHFVSSISSF